MYSSQTQNSSTSLKRARDERQLPPLPKLTSELILQVYTHISLRRQTGVGPEEHGDNERLIELGKAVLDALVTNVLFDRRPMLKVAEICVSLHWLLFENRGKMWSNVLRHSINEPKYYWMRT
jgi:dsRNA-specific ribonuclease